MLDQANSAPNTSIICPRVQLQIPLKVVSPLAPAMLNTGNLGLAGEHQFINAGLAVELCRCWLQRSGHQNLLHYVSTVKILIHLTIINLHMHVCT